MCSEWLVPKNPDSGVPYPLPESSLGISSTALSDILQAPSHLTLILFSLQGILSSVKINHQIPVLISGGSV